MFMRVETKTDLVVDRSLHGELLRINFNMSFPALGCEYATLDISDALGLKRLNLTKTVRKVPIDGDSLRRTGATMEDKKAKEPLYDSEGANESKQKKAERNSHFVPLVDSFCLTRIYVKNNNINFYCFSVIIEVLFTILIHIFFQQFYCPSQHSL